MAVYRSQIEKVLEATVIHSLTTYSWFGKRFGRLPGKIKQSLTAKTARSYLLYNLQSRLYTDFYCPGYVRQSRQDIVAMQAANQTPFTGTLSLANTGKGCWETGWKVNEITDKEVIVQRGDLTLWVDEKCYINSTEGNFISQAAMVSILFPKELFGISPGFYMASSDTEFIDEGLKTLIRYYWNIKAEGAEILIGQITLRLNQILIPFQFKVLNSPDSYTRCDAAVLYIRKADVDSVTVILEDIFPQIIPYLKPTIPAFTKLLAPGLGLGEDPGNGESFGMHRCQLLAEGIISAYEQGKKSIAERLKIVEEGFAKAEICIDTPYLNSNSEDHYKFQSHFVNPIDLSYNQTLSINKHSIIPSFLQTASEIGNYLIQTAIWHDNKCNWLGFELDGDVSKGKQLNIKYSALGPDLYAGTSGIALFLGELYAITRNNEVRRTALGAINQALSRYEILPPSIRLGLFTGWSGIAYTAIRIGISMHEERLIAKGNELFHEALSDKSTKREFDLMSGSAGSITALIAIYKLLNDVSLLKYAIQLGDQLIEAAEKSSMGYSWGSIAFSNKHHVTGFSHGTAGIGYALLALSWASGDIKYHKAADQAFSYEHHWFDSNACNWPDLREEPKQIRSSRRDLPFATFWCHGAPGIALSRLYAYNLYKDQTYRSEAIIALETTRKQILLWLQSGSGDYSLCHGLAGNAEILIYGSQVLGDELDWGFDLAKEVGINGIEMYGKGGHKWPCGTSAGESPGLMLGLAGIGYFYLRLYKPSVSSVLINQDDNPIHNP